MRLNGGDDRESTEHWKKEWMYERNVAVVRRAEAEKASLAEGSSRLDDQVGFVKLVQPPSAITIHPYSSEVVVAGRDTVSVYEFAGCQTPPRVYSFSNKNPRLAQITALEMLNGHEDGMLAVGTDDGALRVYRSWYGQHEQITAWNLLPELIPQVEKIGCPNFASKKVSLQSETKRNANGFAWFCFLFAKLWKKNSLHFALFRFVLLKNMFRFKVSLREQFRFKFFA